MPQKSRPRDKHTSAKAPRISIVLSKDEARKLNAVAEQTERSLSWLGRYAVRRFLEAYEGGQLELPLAAEAAKQ